MQKRFIFLVIFLISGGNINLLFPRGFTRFLGTVAEITDSGIPVHFFTGNHDMWIGDYLVK